MNRKIRIFLFHRVAPQRDLLWNPMSPELFDRIVAYLSKKFEIVPLEKMLLGQYSPTTQKELCAITFDDGYKDFIHYAFPILNKYAAPSSLYVIIDSADKDLPPWTYIVNHVFINTSHLSLELPSEVLPHALQATKWKSPKERIEYARRLSPFMKQLSDQNRKLIYEQILHQFNDVDIPRGMMMTWDEIRQVSANNCEIGSHSKTHPLLTKRISPEQLQTEIFSSGTKIEKEIGKFPLAFAYPFGNYNPEIIDLTAKAGYKMGMAVNNKTYQGGTDTLFEIPRIELYDEPFLKAKLRLNGMIQMFNRPFGQRN